MKREPGVGAVEALRGERGEGVVVSTPPPLLGKK